MAEMNYYDFLMNLENIAIRNGVALMMHRAPVGCGFFFYFQDNHTCRRSDYRSFLMNQNKPEELFAELERVASEFRKDVGDAL